MTKMFTQNPILVSTVLMAFLAPMPASASESRSEETKNLAQAEAIRAQARLTDAQTRLLEEQTRIQSLIGGGIASEASLYREKSLFAKSLLIRLRDLQSEDKSQAAQLQALKRALSGLSDGELLGANIALNNFHKLAIKPVDFAAHQAARDTLLAQISGSNFVRFSNTNSEVPADFPGGTTRALIDFLYAHQYDLKPVDGQGVEALQAVGNFAQTMLESVDAHELMRAQTLGTKIDSLMSDIDELSKYNREATPAATSSVSQAVR